MDKEFLKALAESVTKDTPHEELIRIAILLVDFITGSPQPE